MKANIDRFILDKWNEYPEGFLKRHLARYAWALKQIDYDSTVLEIGSGTGYGSFIIKAGCEKVKGIDKSSEAIEYARKRFNFPNLEFDCVDIVDYEIKDNEHEAYDVIVAIESLEHISNPDHVMFKIIKLLKPDGKFLVTTPVGIRYSGFIHPDHYHEYSEVQLSSLMKSYFSSYELDNPLQHGIMPYKGRDFLLCVNRFPKKSLL